MVVCNSERYLVAVTREIEKLVTTHLPDGAVSVHSERLRTASPAELGKKGFG